MKARIILPKIKSRHERYYPVKKNDIWYLPFKFFKIYNYEEKINVVKSISGKWDYKFVYENKVYWINKDMIQPTIDIGGELFEL